MTVDGLSVIPSLHETSGKFNIGDHLTRETEQIDSNRILEEFPTMFW